MSEQEFEVAIGGGVLRGHLGGEGPPALLLHGGAAVPDYLDGLAAELAPFLTTYRYTQRGTPPSTGGPPYTIEAHMADALAMLDAFEIPRAWFVGHSWGGHLALHLSIANPERLLGVVCIDPLGSFANVFDELDAALRRELSPETPSTSSGRRSCTASPTSSCRFSSSTASATPPLPVLRPRLRA